MIDARHRGCWMYIHHGGNMKDWTGDSNAIYSTLGASNHSKHERENNDYYATNPKALEMLLELESFSPVVWECACGQGHLSEVLKAHGHKVISTDLIDRGYGERCDFLNDLETLKYENFDGDIITNPPYKYALQFVRKALELVTEGHKVAMFLRIQFLEGVERRTLFNATPPRTVYVASKRIACALNGEFENAVSSAICYSWFVWEKGYKGDTIVKWFN